jgi:RNA polymerase sigma factor (sigma-70 family)
MTATSQTITLMADRNQRIGDLVKDYGKRLFGFIRGRVNSEEDARDILQDVWFQLSSVVDLEGIEQIGGWLFSVARNRITDRYRKKSMTSADENRLLEEEGDSFIREMLFMAAEDPDLKELKELFWDELMAALDELPENQRKVFILNELEDQTLQEIADQEGEKLKTIISRKGYAVKHLRKRLETLYREFLNQ